MVECSITYPVSGKTNIGRFYPFILKLDENYSYPSICFSTIGGKPGINYYNVTQNFKEITIAVKWRKKNLLFQILEIFRITKLLFEVEKLYLPSIYIVHYPSKFEGIPVYILAHLR